MLNGLEGTEFGDEFYQRAVDLSTELLTPPDVDKGLALGAHLWILERATGEGLPLTAAGYLKPADARQFAELLHAMSDYPWAGTREVDARPVLYFREYLKAVGLLRRYKGTLRLTRAGRDGLDNVDALWRHLADTLVPEASLFTEHCAVTLMVYAATSERTVRPERIARILTAHGWRQENGDSVSEREVYPVWNDLWTALGNVGTPEPSNRLREPFARELSEGARALVRDALFHVVREEPVAQPGVALRKGGYRPSRLG